MGRDIQHMIGAIRWGDVWLGMAITEAGILVATLIWAVFLR